MDGDTWFGRMIALMSDYAFYYPFLMTHIWTIGAFFYYVKWERRHPGTGNASVALPLPFCPPLSILLPCHNEGDNLVETVSYLAQQKYPAFEIIAINDGSTDDTGDLLDRLLPLYAQLRVVHLAENQGKAVALRAGALLAKSEYLVCIDGDALLDADACRHLVSHFAYPHVGAVTGNPRIRNRSTLLGKIQVGEFSSIVGIIKRAQRIYGRIFSVSGVIAAFRKSALAQVDFWTPDMITEDVDVTWKLQRAQWDIRFEPQAKCWILMPETLAGLWKQRLRWAQGGSEVLLRNAGIFRHWSQRSMWLMYVELAASLLWVYVTAALIAMSLLDLVIGNQTGQAASPMLFSSHTTLFLLIVTSLMQFAFGLYLDSRYERQLWKTYGWIIWYPMLYWVLIAAATFVGFPKALFRKKGQRAIWRSPDRGFKP